MEKERQIIKISVRNLVEFILCSGDLDNRRGKKADKEAMQAGSRIHRKIQKQMGSHYRAEVPLRLTVPMQDFDCILEGRADGIFEENGIITIDEIKGIYRDLEHVTKPVFVHQAQAMCYAYIYAAEQQLETIRIQMTYCNLDTEAVKYFSEEIGYDDLKSWFQNLMEEYEKWAQFQYEWHLTRKESIGSIEFPFEYREGQKELAGSVYRTFQRQKQLFIQAPTGVGKTMSTVFPAVKALGEELGDKIFYLTAKTVTRTVAAEAFDILRRQGLRMKTVILTAKEKMCICDELNCNPEACPYAKGHYDRVNEAVFDLLTHETDSLTREVLLEQANKYQVCPFEMSLDVSTWVDAIICDYNYVFDPNVHLKRFFAEGVKGDYLFLIDEAHNLVERGREMYSASLYKEDFLELKRMIKGRYHKIEKRLEQCNKYLLSLKRECDRYELIPDVGSFAMMLLSLMGELEKIQEEAVAQDLQERISEMYLQVRHFLNIYERLDENYVIYTEMEEDVRFKIKLFCIETSVNLKECLDKGKGTVFFSATLLPIGYYKHLLGQDDDYAIYADSPFEQSRRLLMIGKDVSSKFTRRGPREYVRMAEYIARTVESKQGNYLVFFPSYKMMLEVHAVWKEKYQSETMESLLQHTGMDEIKREQFLARFEIPEDGKSLVGFCVMGGIFSEGIDLKHEALIGTVIVGTGLPQVCNEREILKNYYDKRKMNGFDYAYLYPGMNKVLQAAGRVIRTSEDTGVILLLDERFTMQQYKKLFPREWEQHSVCTISNVEEQLHQFWLKSN